MRLECTVVAGPAAPAVPVTEITVHIPGDPPVPGTMVRDALAARWPGVPFTVDGKVVEDLSAGIPPLVTGAVLVAGGAPRSPGCGPAPVLLAVLSGPGSGAILPLRRGRYRVGRGRVDLSIPDPSLSRHHLTVAVDREGIRLTPADGSPVELLRPSATASLRFPCALRVGDVIDCGHTQLAVRLVTGPPGRLDLDGMPSGNSLGPPGEPLQVPRPGGPARNAGALMAMIALPLVGGLVLAWVTRSWMFLGFTALSALTGVIPLLSGRRHRRDFHTAVATAVAEDRRRRLEAHPPPGDLCLPHAAPAATPVSASAGPPVSTPPAPAVATPAAPAVLLPGAVPHVRLGTARLPANLLACPADRSFLPPLVEGLPMVVPVPPEGLDLMGAPALAAALWNFLLMQLARTDAGVVVRGPVGSFLPSVRFLPGVVAEVTGDGEPMIVLPSGAAIRLRPAHHCAGATVVELSCRGEQPAGTITGTCFVPDGVPDPVFDRYARRCAAGAARSGPATALVSVPIPGSGFRSAEAVRTRWNANRGRRLAAVVIGQGRSGPEFLDLCRDGPHLLVGGTTGAGKSEFLRTLAGSLAAAHSPADLAFVYLDFKGGAALGPLTAFPHSSSLVTDLDDYAMERTLVSIRTEIRWREALLFAAGASDLDEFRQTRCTGTGMDAAVGHLVVLVDEFRVLVDQHPQAMAELMRCASVGRSLGIHLVLATQRPQGAVSSDIRANVTSAICLRVQSALDSQDVLGTGQAAEIATSTPGRAFLRRAGMAPTEFQAGSLRAGCGPEPPAVIVDFPATGGKGLESTASTSDVPAVAALLTEAWTGWTSGPGESGPGESGPREAESGRRAHRGARPARPSPVVAAALPEVIELPPGRDIQLGLVDLPRQQRLERLCWSPARHSHLACIGPRGSGAPEALALIVRQFTGPAIRRGATQPWFVYLLDGDGSLAGSLRPPGVLLPAGTDPSSACVGSSLGIGEVRAAARLVRRLAEVGNDGCPRMLLCISGWGHWVSAFRNSPWPEAEDVVADLARIQGGNLVLAISGERELLNARFMASLPNRLYFPHGASMESRVAWPRLPGFKSIPGRAAGSGPVFAEAAAARGREPGPAAREGGRRRADDHEPGGSPRGSAAGTWATGKFAAENMEELFVAQTGQEPPIPAVDHRHRLPLPDGTADGAANATADGTADSTSDGADSGSGFSNGAAEPPLRLASLPSRLGVAHVLAAVPRPTVLAGTSVGAVLQLLVGLGGDGATPVNVAVAPHGLLLVLGAPGTGKSTFLEAVAALNPADLAGGPVQLVDDIDRLDPVRLEALRCAADAGAMILATADNEARALLRLPSSLGARNPAQGVILRPRRPHDGDLLGVRLDVEATEPPGRAVLVNHGLLEWFQFPDPEHRSDARAGHRPG